jgi:hypothetical protein
MDEFRELHIRTKRHWQRKIRELCITVKNGSQAANQMFFAFPVLKLTTCLLSSYDKNIAEAKKIIERRRSHFSKVSH